MIARIPHWNRFERIKLIVLSPIRSARRYATTIIPIPFTSCSALVSLTSLKHLKSRYDKRIISRISGIDIVFTTLINAFQIFSKADAPPLYLIIPSSYYSITKPKKLQGGILRFYEFFYHLGSSKYLPFGCEHAGR